MKEFFSSIDSNPFITTVEYGCIVYMVMNFFDQDKRIFFFARCNHMQPAISDKQEAVSPCQLAVLKYTRRLRIESCHFWFSFIPLDASVLYQDSAMPRHVCRFITPEK
jgi:hypothetical protein